MSAVRTGPARVDGLATTVTAVDAGTIGRVSNIGEVDVAALRGGINVLVSAEEMARRRAEQDAKGWKPAQPRPRKVSAALKAYALLAMSADKGAVRDLSLLGD